MKRFFPLLLISTFLVVFLTFTGCGTDRDSAKLSVKDSISANYETLSKQLEAAVDFQQVSDCLSGWARENKIDVKTKGDQYIVLSKSASAGYEDAQTVTLQCSVDLSGEETKEDDLQTAAAAMSFLYGAENHGTIKAVFTARTNGEPVGANAIDEKYLKTDNFVALNYERDAALYNSIAASSEITASRDLKRSAPNYTKAYTIELTGTQNKSPYKYRGDYPNAIKTIGDLLASCNSSAVLFELASFNGGEASDLYPGTARAVLVLQENDVESFTKKFENSYEKVEDFYDELEEPFTYTMTGTKLPDKVIATEDTDNIVSLMYTITNGTYQTSENGDVTAASNIGRVSTKGGRFKLSINAKSLENSTMDEMHTVFKTTCGLCDIKYKEVNSTKLWYSSEKNPLISALTMGPKIKPAGTLEHKEAAAFLEKNPNLNLAVWSTNTKSAPRQIETLLQYAESFGETKNQ